MIIRIDVRSPSDVKKFPPGGGKSFADYKFGVILLPLSQVEYSENQFANWFASRFRSSFSLPKVLSSSAKLN